jgi:transposase
VATKSGQNILTSPQISMGLPPIEWGHGRWLPPIFCTTVEIPVRKVPLVLNTLTGLVLTQGAITQDALRRARGEVGQKYQGLRAGVRNAPAVYTDDTGWKVGGENAHLMAFDTDQATIYQVRLRHRHREVQEVVPRNYQGVMGTDRGRSYEASPSAG